MRDALKRINKKITEIYDIVDAKAKLYPLIAEAQNFGQEPHKNTKISLDVNAMRSMEERLNKRLIK
jgi:hypothetical protein